MEKSIPNSNLKRQQGGGRDALWLLLCAAAGALSVIIWPVFWLLPAMWAVCMARLKPHWLAFLTVVTFGAAYWLFESWLTAACLALMVALMALAIYVLGKRGVNLVYTAAIMAALATAALYGIVCMPGVISGEGAFAAVQGIFGESIAAAKQVVAATPGMPEDLLNAWTQYMDVFEESIPSLVVPVLCAVACTLALSNILFFRLFVRKRDFGLTPLRPFYEWSIPNGMTTGLVLFMIASVILSCAGWEYAPALSGTINVIVGFPLMVQGLSTADFLIRRAKKNVNLIRTLVYIAVVLLFSLLSSVLVLMGCFEQVFHLRERIKTGTLRTPMA